MNNQIEDNIIIRDAVIINKNFEGRVEKPYNMSGIRRFTVLLDEEVALQLQKIGWPVNIKPDKDPEMPPIGYLNVTVGYNGKIPPKIIQITRRNGRPKMTPISEATVSTIDCAEIKDVKLEIRPYNWNVNGKTGTSAYLKTMYYELVEDVFAADYEDFDDPSFSEIPFEED